MCWALWHKGGFKPRPPQLFLATTLYHPSCSNEVNNAWCEKGLPFVIFEPTANHFLLCHLEFYCVTSGGKIMLLKLNLLSNRLNICWFNKSPSQWAELCCTGQEQNWLCGEELAFLKICFYLKFSSARLGNALWKVRVQRKNWAGFRKG